MRIAHLSDIHFWQYEFNPLRLIGKRLIGMTELAMGRARRFRLERAADLIARVQSVAPDHILITGDLTTTSLPAEFRAASRALAPLLADPARVTIIPGNHDRYTLYAHRSRRFEWYFGAFAPAPRYPWARPLDAQTAIVGLDPTRSAITAHGKLPAKQLQAARELLTAAGPIARPIIACHYPLAVPPRYAREYGRKDLVNRNALEDWLRTIGPHVFCCGHVHAAWAFRPETISDQLCCNAGAALMRDHTEDAPSRLSRDRARRSSGRRPPSCLDGGWLAGDRALPGCGVLPGLPGSDGLMHACPSGTTPTRQTRAAEDRFFRPSCAGRSGSSRERVRLLFRARRDRRRRWFGAPRALRACAWRPRRRAGSRGSPGSSGP